MGQRLQPLQFGAERRDLPAQLVGLLAAAVAVGGAERPVAVLIEPHTFGAPRSSALVVGALATVDIPSYLVKRDDSLPMALSPEMAQGRLR